MVADFTKDYGKIVASLNINKWMDLYSFADAFVAGYFDQRNYTNIDYPLEPLYNRSLDIVRVDMFENLFGDENQAIAINAMSPVVNRLYTYWDNVIASDNSDAINPDPKMVLYSGHDTNIAALMIYLNTSLSLKMTSYPYVNFASNYIIELNQNDGVNKPYSRKDYTVSISYNGGNIYSGSYESFKSASDGIMYSSEKTASFCDFQSPKPSGDINDSPFITGVLLIAIGILSLIAIALIIAIIFVVMRRRKETDSPYHQV